MKKNYTCLYLCFICFFTPALAQDQYPTDSLLKALQESRDDSVKFDLFIDLHNAYFKSNPEESKNYALKMIELGEQMHDLRRQYKGYIALNRYESKFRNYERIIPNSKKLLSLALDLGDTDEIFNCTIGLAYKYIDGEYNDLVVPQLEEAMKVALNNNNDLQVNKVNYALGFFYHQIGAPEKAIPFIEKAIRKFRAIQDEKSLAEAIRLYAESSLEIKADPQTLNLLIVAEKLHEKNQSLYRRAYVRELMGRYFALSDNSTGAVENFYFAREMYNRDHNEVEYALVGLDLSGELLLQKQFSPAKKLLEESETIINERNYAPGKIQLEIARINYLLSTNQFSQVKTHLDHLSQMADSSKATDVQLAAKQLTAVYLQKTGSTSAVGKAYFDYYKTLFQYKGRQPLITALKLMERRYGNADSNLEYVRKIALSAEGYYKLKRYFAEHQYSNVVLPDSFYTLIHTALPDADTSLVHILSMSYDAQLDAVDAVLNKKMLLQRLSEQKNTVRKNFLWGGILAALLLLIISVLVVYSRRLKRKKEQSDKDNKTIELLHNQLNHTMVNNLRSVSNYIDAAMKTADLKNAIYSLKIRVNVASDFYTFFKEQHVNGSLENGDKVNLQKHIERLDPLLKAVHNVDDDFVTIAIDAPLELRYHTGLSLVLLLSEWIQNSCKHAFDHDDIDSENRINIQVFVDKGDVLRMKYQDNGKGKPDVVSTSLGTEIINEIVETLGAEIKEYNQDGYHVELLLKLKKDEYKKT